MLKTIHTNTNIIDIGVTPRTVIIIGQIIAIGIDHKTLNIVHTTDYSIDLTIDHTIIHKTDHTIDNNTNAELKSMKLMSSVIAVLIAQTGQIVRTTALTMTPKK